eukprot:511917_1
MGKARFLLSLSISVVITAVFVSKYYDSLYDILFDLTHNPMDFFYRINVLYPPFNPPIIRNTSQIPFKWTHILRDNYEIILQEFIDFQSKYPNYNKLHFDNLIPTQLWLNRDSKWLAVMLRCYGYETSVSHTYFPQTMKLVKETDKYNYLQQVMLSILNPNKSIPVHNGYYRGILRYQLSLLIPKHKHKDLHLKLWPNTSDISYTKLSEIENRDKYEMITWYNGSDVIFDDTNIHSVHNTINKTRIVLFIDFERPDLSLFQTIINKIILFITPKVNPMCHNAMEIQNSILNMNHSISPGNI